MVKRYVIQLTALSDLPAIGRQEIAAAITKDLNARGIELEQLLIEEVKE